MLQNIDFYMIDEAAKENIQKFKFIFLCGLKPSAVLGITCLFVICEVLISINAIKIQSEIGTFIFY